MTVPPQRPDNSGKQALQRAVMAFNSQRVIILAGLPASGKTTLSKRLADFGFVWINQVKVHQTIHTASLRLYEDTVQEPHKPCRSFSGTSQSPLLSGE